MGRLLRHLGPDVLRHHQHRRHALRGRSPPGAAPQPRPGPRARASASTPRPEMEFFYFADADTHVAAAAARPGVVLRPHHRRRRVRPAPAHDPHARGDGHPGGVQPPRGRAQPARDRPALHRRPHDGRQRHDVPARGAGGRLRGRRARHLHAQAARRRAGLGHAHPLLALRGRHQRLLRPGRRAQPVEGRPRVHRRRAHPRPGDRRGHQPVGELLQAPGRRLRGAGVRELGAQQPLGGGQRAADQGRARPTRPASSSGPPTRAATPTWRSRWCWPPGCAASRRATTSRPRRSPTSTSSPRRSGWPRASRSCPGSLAEALDEMERRSWSPRRSASTSSSGSSATSAPSGRSTRPRSRQFELDRYLPRL